MTDSKHRIDAGLGLWASILFIVGSACFALGGFSGLYRQPDTAVNAVFFAGSLFFTFAAYLQLLESANTDIPGGPFPGKAEVLRFQWFGWQPGNTGWLSSVVQLVGTLLFNLSTADALLPGFNWYQEDLSTWAPDVLGCAFFLISSWLAIVEYGRGHSFWRIDGPSWWIVTLNMLGSVAFGISAYFSFIPAKAADALNLKDSNLWVSVGALCFLAGSVLMNPVIQKKKN